MIEQMFYQEKSADRATSAPTVASESRGTQRPQAPQPRCRSDADRRDDRHRESPHPRPPPGSPRGSGEQRLSSTPTCSGQRARNALATNRSGDRLGDRVERLVSGRSTNCAGPRRSGGDGVLSRPRYDAAVQRAAAGATRRITILLATATLALVAGCTSSTPTPSPSTSVATATPAPSAPTTSPTGTAAPGPTRPGQTDTDWERIWNDIPADFPAYPAARPTETGAGPASAILDAGAARPAQVT